MVNAIRIFISYARIDGRGHVERLSDALKGRKISVWFDRDINRSQDFSKELEAEIEKASYVVVCLTPDIKNSDWVRREIMYAQVVGTPIISLRFDEAKPIINVIDLTYIDFFNRKWDDAFDELVDAVQPQVTSETSVKVIAPPRS